MRAKFSKDNKIFMSLCYININDDDADIKIMGISIIHIFVNGTLIILGMFFSAIIHFSIADGIY